MRGAYINFETVKMTLGLGFMQKLFLSLCQSEIIFAEFHSFHFCKIFNSLLVTDTGNNRIIS